MYCHCTFDKGNCRGQYVREEELERQFQRIFDGFRLADVIVDWVRDALRQSEREQATYHDNEIEKLDARYAILQNSLREIHLDKLDGEIDNEFYKRSTKEWRDEQSRILKRIERHQEADENYIEQGIRLLELAQNAGELSRSRSQADLKVLLDFIMPDSVLEAGTVIPTFKPPFGIIHRLAENARTVTQTVEAARLILLPRGGLELFGLRPSGFAYTVGLR